MAITAHDLMRLGLDKLLEFLGLEREELQKLLVEQTVLTPEQLSRLTPEELVALELRNLAVFLSAEYDICGYCGNNFVVLVESSVCDDCTESLWWRDEKW